MKKWKCLLGIIALALAIYLCQKLGNVMLKSIATDADVETKKQKYVVVIDAGHGSSDPGKVGINQILEKDVNLKIAKKLEKLLAEKSIQVIMTRQDDTSIQNSKSEDLKQRVDIINQTNPTLAVSIHQNSYTSESVKGAQVFYHGNSKEGERAAKILQNELQLIDPDNSRQSKANSSYYLLKNTEVPLVIVECGFLSNPSEAEKLSTDDYQQKIAEAICSGIVNYLNLQIFYKYGVEGISG